jgi:hypothetical protein
MAHGGAAMISAPVKPDLFSLHARARGELVNGPEQADAVFSVKRGVTPFDLDVIRADFL